MYKIIGTVLCDIENKTYFEYLLLENHKGKRKIKIYPFLPKTYFKAMEHPFYLHTLIPWKKEVISNEMVASKLNFNTLGIKEKKVANLDLVR